MSLPSRVVPILTRRGLSAGLILWAAAACGGDDTARPVAAVTVTPARARVGIGGPLELTFRFDVQPGTAIQADYAVFVHMVNAEGRTIWIDGHEPAVPTSRWQAGQTVQYTRTAFLPSAGLAPGEVTLLVGLHRDDRLPLESVRGSRDRAYPVATVALAPESENIFLIYTNGWHDEEHAEDASRSWTWTERAAALSFRNPKADVTFYLEYAARPEAFSGRPQQVTISAGGQRIETFEADSPNVTLRRIVVPAAALGSGEMAEIRIEVDRVFVPAALPAGGRDARSLGLQVYHAFVDRR
jgi:hypothetical protein